MVAQPGHAWAELDHAGFADRLTDMLVEMGGSFSAEHGIGRAKAATLEARKEPAQVGLMRRIRRAFDGDARLNPGVLMDAG